MRLVVSMTLYHMSGAVNGSGAGRKVWWVEQSGIKIKINDQNRSEGWEGCQKSALTCSSKTADPVSLTCSALLTACRPVPIDSVMQIYTVHTCMLSLVWEKTVWDNLTSGNSGREWQILYLNYFYQILFSHLLAVIASVSSTGTANGPGPPILPFICRVTDICPHCCSEKS